MTDNPVLDIIIVNWNSGEQLSDCLQSVAAAEGDRYALARVIVVDNASGDTSLAKLDELGLPLTLLRNAMNRGFGAACNQGAAGTKADYLLFLNPDTRLFKNTLAKSLDFMERPGAQKYGILGVQLVDQNLAVTPTCARFPSPRSFLVRMLGLDRLWPRLFPGRYMTEWDHGESREADQVMGAFFLVRRQVFEALGGFDEGFFLYFEEVDFSLRARDKGWPSYFLADTGAFHKGGGTTEQVLGQRLFYSLQSRILYSFKHFSRPKAFVVTLGTLFLEPLAHLTWVLMARGCRESVQLAEGYLKLWRELPTLCQKLWRIHHQGRNRE